MSSRQRSTSATEEAALDAYVQTCTQFKTNVHFTYADAVKAATSTTPDHILLIGTEEQLKDDSVHTLPFYCDTVAAAIARIDKNCKSAKLLVHKDQFASQHISLSIAAIPSKAARTNCPYRPDCITNAINAATASLSGDGQHTLDVYIRTPADAHIAVANAAARASPHSYSAKSGRATSAFLHQPITINVIFASPITPARAAELDILCTSVQLCQRLVDTPTCVLDTVIFAEIAQAYAAELGATCDVIKGDELRERGYGGMYAVGKGAQYPPHLVTLQYRNAHAEAHADAHATQAEHGSTASPMSQQQQHDQPSSTTAAATAARTEHADAANRSHGRGKQAINIALVGKGIVYDCGGLALKPAEHMTNMKTDMGGAAAVFCGFIAMLRLMRASPQLYKHIDNVSVTLCLAENAIGPCSYRNDDIVIMKSGKTIEVLNTDAEGRIVLGDGVFHATNELSFVPDVLIDMATLTGAQGIATGERHAAIYANDAEAEASVLQAGRRSGDVCFPVLYCPEFHAAQYESPHADMRNIMLKRTDAGVSCGGYFVECHLSDRFKGQYIHVDLAYPSSNKDGATGYGVSLLTEYCK